MLIVLMLVKAQNMSERTNNMCNKKKKKKNVLRETLSDLNRLL